MIRLFARTPFLVSIDDFCASGEGLAGLIFDVCLDARVCDHDGGERRVGYFARCGLVEEVVEHGVAEEAAEVGLVDVAGMGDLSVGDGAV